MFRKLATIYNKMADLSTKCVTVTDNNGTRIITEKEEMKKAIVEENRQKYHQTEESCPFMKQPLREHFGPVGMETETQAALDGDYVPPNNISPQTQSFIELCKIPQDELVINPLTRSLDYFASS